MDVSELVKAVEVAGSDANVLEVGNFGRAVNGLKLGLKERERKEERIQKNRGEKLHEKTKS